MTSKACFWEIWTDFRWSNLRKQDYRIEIVEKENVKVYMSAFFLDDRESNTTVDSQLTVGSTWTFEMYNKTAIYVVPTGNGDNVKFKFNISVTDVQVYDKTQRYEQIQVYISGYGSALLILAILIYLGAFQELYRLAHEAWMERQQKLAE